MKLAVRGGLALLFVGQFLGLAIILNARERDNDAAETGLNIFGAAGVIALVSLALLLTALVKLLMGLRSAWAHGRIGPPVGLTGV